MTCWADASYAEDAKAKAVAAFDAFEVNAVQVASADASGASLDSFVSSFTGIFKDLGAMFKKSPKVAEGENAEEVKEEPAAPVFADKSVEVALNDSYLSVIPKLEKKIADWQVAVSIASVKPLKAKIGKKEGLRNGQRFRSYMYTEDKDGNLVSKKRGYLRATTVIDNRGYASGSTDMSSFYQISGGENIQEGWIIKQKNDIKLGVSVMGRVGGLSNFGVKVDLDYLAHFSRVGSLYPMVSIGIDPTSMAIDLGGSKSSNLNFGIGAGYGLHALRWLEIMPYITLGADVFTLPKEITEINKKASATAFLIEPGLRVGFQVAYPVSLFVKGGYDILVEPAVGGNNYYSLINAIAKNPHKSGLFVDFGIRVGF